MAASNSTYRRSSRQTGPFLAVLLVVCSTVALPSGPGAGLYFERVGSESGPPPEVITALYQDRAGFIWIGSRDGLFRFDGYSFVVFEHDVSDPTSISDNAIRVIYEDRSGNLWIGTNTGGLDRLDRATWEFEHFRHDSTDPFSLSHNSVYAIHQDSTGTLWVGTQIGLNRLDPDTRRFERHLADPGNPRGLSNDYVMAILEDRQKRLWIATLGGGVNLWNPDSGGFVVYRSDPDVPTTVSHDRVLAITEDADERLWFGTATGLSLLNPDATSFRRFGSQGTGTSTLSHSLITSLVPGPPGKLWVGTYGGGLNQLDTESGEMRVMRHDPDRRDSLADDRVVSLLADNSGMLWIGTWGGGLNRITTPSMLLSALPEGARIPDEVAGVDVTDVMSDSQGNLWIGTREDGLYRVDVRGGVRQYLEGGQLILRLAERRDGSIWVGTSGRLLRVDSVSGEVRELAHDANDPTTLGPGYVTGLLVDSADRLWVGTGEGGLHLLGPEGDVQERFVHDPDDPTTLSDDYVTALFEDRRGVVWVGTRSGGLNSFDPGSGSTVRYLPDRERDDSLSHHYITSFAEDSRGSLWIGTAGGGINRAEDLGSGDGVRFTKFTAVDGLIDDDVMAVLVDDDDSLWLSTKSGLSRFDPATGGGVNFHVTDGLPASEFEPGSATRTPGALYFGSVKGPVVVPAGTRLPTPEPSPIVITSIQSATGEITGDRPVWELERFEIPHGEWLSIEVAVLDFDTGHNHAYAYRLGDERESWVELGARRAITFTELDSGRHAFAIRGRNCQGAWSNAIAPLQIVVVPPFWMTIWFRLLMLLAVVALAFTGHLVRLSRLEARNRELVAWNEQREKARDELGRAYDRLRRLTRRLEAAKEDERRVIARELHDEMGPTLTAVIINLQLLFESPDREAMSRRIEDTVDLVDRMVQRVRDLSLDLRPPLLDELGLMPALKGYMEAQGERSGLAINVAGGPTNGLPPEIEITAFRVVQEAVTNVIRHADASRVNIAVHQERDELRLTVDDDGVGFDVPSFSDGTAFSKGLGLLGMQERVRMLDGEVHIDSRPGGGTKVKVRMPVELRP